MAVKNALKQKANGNVTQRDPSTAMRAMLKQMATQIAMALPAQMSTERFQRVALTAFNENKKLQQCDPLSFIAAMMQSAQLGLEPNTPLGQAYLIPYGRKVQFQIGYKGLLTLAHRTGEYKSIYAHDVRENDVFDIDYGLANLLVHKPLLTGDRGKVIGYYAVYKLVNGGEAFYFMTCEEAEAHGIKFSKTYNDGPWQTDYDAMAKKTVLKMLLKYAPLSVEFANEVVADEKVVSSITDDGRVDYMDAIDVTETAEAIPDNVDPETGEILDEAKEAHPEAFFPEDFEPVEI